MGGMLGEGGKLNTSARTRRKRILFTEQGGHRNGTNLLPLLCDGSELRPRNEKTCFFLFPSQIIQGPWTGMQ